MKDVAKELLLGIEPRGQDATGMAWFGREGGLVIDKSPMPATSFTTQIKMNNNASTAILHTRLATTGRPEDNKNNHPIKAAGPRGERVIGTHNGWLNNYASLTKLHNLVRNAKVDSEVIFALLQKYGDDWDKLGDLIDGNYACAYLREDRPGELFLVRGHSSPLVLMQTAFGWFYASTEGALRGLGDLVGGPQMGFTEVVEGRALRFKDGEFIDAESFSMRSRWGKYYGNQVHTGTRTVYQRDAWEDDDYWYGTRSNHVSRGTWAKNPETGVFELRPAANASTSDGPGTGGNSFIGAYTDTKRGVRVYYGEAAAERRKFLGMADDQEEYPSAYGKYIDGKTKNRETLEFHPWPGMSEQFNTEESVLEDLLFLTVDLDRDSIPDMVRYEIAQLNGKLQRKAGRTGMDLKRNGVLMGDGWAVEHGKLINPDGEVVTDHKTIPEYMKVGGVWYYLTFNSKPSTDEMGDYVIERSSFQADTDHINPRAIAPPAARAADGEGLADYCLIGERIYGMDEDGTWGDLGLNVNDLTTDELFTMGLSFDPLADSNGGDEFTVEDYEQLQAMLNGVREEADERRAIEGRKVG